MINNDSPFENNEGNSDTNLPLNEANASNTESKLRDYGKKSLAPLIDLVSKYKGDINPYFSAISKGLQGAVTALESNSSVASNGASNENSSFNTSSEDENRSLDSDSRNSSMRSESATSSESSTQSVTDADRIVAGWFRDASGWFSGAQEKIASGNAKELLGYLEAEAAKSPGLMFSTSYVVGLFFGRLGRHMGRQKVSESTSVPSSVSSSVSDSSLNDLH